MRRLPGPRTRDSIFTDPLNGGRRLPASGLQSGRPHGPAPRSLVELGRSLGLRVVAEGIETQEVQEALISFDCAYGQGFHLGRPAPAEEVLAALRASRPEEPKARTKVKPARKPAAKRAARPRAARQATTR